MTVQKLTAGTSTGADLVGTVNSVVDSAGLNFATLANAITFAESGNLAVGGVVAAIDSGVSYQLIDGATERPNESGSVVHVSGGSGYLYLKEKAPLKTILAASKTTRYITTFGNSIMNARYNYMVWFCAKSQGAFMLYENAAIGGNNTDDMVARLDDIPLETDVLFVMEATNDAATTEDVDHHTSNMKLIFEYAISNGIRPILVLSPPNDDSARSILVDQMNQKDWQLAKSMGVTVYNPWEDFSDTDGAWVVGASADGTHPNGETHQAVGETLYNQFIDDIYARLSPRINDQGLIPNGLLMLNNGANTDIPSTFWRSFTSASLAETAFCRGRTWEANFLNTSGTLTSSYIPVVVGHTYMFTCKFAADVSSGSPDMSLFLEPDYASRVYIFDEMSTDIDDSTFVAFFTPRDGQTEVRMKFAVASGTHDLTTKLGEVQFYDLTELGEL